MGVEKGIERDVVSSERAWYENQKAFLLLLVVLVAALSLPYFRILNDALPDTHPAVVSLIAGGVMTAVSYIPMYYINSKFALSNALLIGILVSKFCIYGAPCSYPAPLLIAFFFFMFFYGYEERTHLWPSDHQCSISSSEAPIY